MDQDYLKRRVTIYQVAKESGYSLATVSRVINNKENVTEETKIKVMEVIEKLGYKPSAIAQGLAKSKSTNVGIVIPNSMHMYVASMLSGMVDIAKIYGFQTTLFTTTQNTEEVSEVVESIISSNVDGVVVFDDQLSEKDIDKLVNYGTPVSVIGREVIKENVASIPLEYENSIKQIINEHFENGNEEIYFLHIINNSSAMMDTLEALCLEECKKLNKENLFKKIEVEDSYSKTFEQFKEYFKENKTGFFIAPRDTISCGVANAANENGISIPNEVQIVSVIGTKYSTIVRPTLTTFEIDMYEVGSIAMRMLTKLLNGTLKNKSYPFYSTIQHRSSTK